jgi:hypothetical protein
MLKYNIKKMFKHKVKVKLSLCLTNYALRHEDVWESGCIEPRLLDLGTGSRCGDLHGKAALSPGKEPPVFIR